MVLAENCQAMTNFQGSTCTFSNDDKFLTVTATTSANSTTTWTFLNPRSASPELPIRFTTCDSVLTGWFVPAEFFQQPPNRKQHNPARGAISTWS